MEDNIQEFVKECAQRLCTNQSDNFIDELEMFENEGYGVHNKGITSPIEQILFAAMLHNIKANNVNLADPETIGDFDIVSGIDIKPQFIIGKYRVDFRVENTKYVFSRKENRMLTDKTKFVIVECDSQKWHERTEKERRYEKARDRYLTKQNIKVFHYTGKEIIDKPYEIAAEILKEVLGYNCTVIWE